MILSVKLQLPKTVKIKSSTDLKKYIGRNFKGVKVLDARLSSDVKPDSDYWKNTNQDIDKFFDSFC